MKWDQTTDFFLGLWDGIYEEFKGNLDGVKSLVNYTTYKALMEFCIAIAKGEVTIDNFRTIIEDGLKSQIEPIKYVLENTVDVFNPKRDVSDEKVREYAKNLLKAVITIMDIKNALRDLPEELEQFADFSKKLYERVKEIEPGDYKDPKIKIKLIEDNVTSKKKFRKDALKAGVKRYVIEAYEKTSSGWLITDHAAQALMSKNRFDGMMSIDELDDYLESRFEIIVMDRRQKHFGNINAYVESPYSDSSLLRITVSPRGKRLVSIGFQARKDIYNFIDWGDFKLLLKTRL